MINNTCEACRYFKAGYTENCNYGESSWDGYCTYNPPQVIKEPDKWNDWRYFPKVLKADYCSKCSPWWYIFPEMIKWMIILSLVSRI